jgi:lipopolysaccharide exporter
MVGMRWTDRLIGIIGVLILARLLIPADFGVIAMASVVVGLMDALLGFGVTVAIIQRRDATDDHYHSAWTLRLIQYSCIAGALWVVAPYAAHYFDEPRVDMVIRILALGVVVSAFENIGIISFQKEMMFRQDFLFTFLKRVVTFTTTVVAAILLRSYWALVIGTLAGRVFGVGLSYMLHPMRPRPSFRKFREVFEVSQWMLLKGIGAYLDRSLHTILVGRVSTTATTGGYTLAQDISRMPTSEVLAPLNRVLFPAFVQAKADPSRLRSMFLLAQGVQTLLVFPVAVGMALVAEDAVRLMLGERWLLAAPFLQLLAFASAGQAITTSANYVLITMGRMAMAALLDWVRVGLFAVAAFMVYSTIDAHVIAELRIFAVIGALVFTAALLVRALPEVRLTDLARTIGRPLIATVTMAAVLLSFERYVSLAYPFGLLIDVGLGAVTYLGMVVALWHAAGKPDGAESYMLAKARAGLTALRNYWRMRGRASTRG